MRDESNLCRKDKASRKEVFVTGWRIKEEGGIQMRCSAHTQMLRIVLLVLAFVNDISGISFVIVVHRISDAHCFALFFGLDFVVYRICLGGQKLIELQSWLRR